MRLIFATHNPGKLEEMKTILAGLPYDILSATEACFLDEVVEDGETFAQNALKKATEIAVATQAPALADDSGICIDALCGAPGVFSARWAGEGASGEQLVDLTLNKLRHVPDPDRTGAFVCVAALALPDGRQWTFEGRVDGSIAHRPEGLARPKLPYDVIFVPKGDTRTFAQMSENEKHALSHRGHAMRKVRAFLEQHPI